MSIQIYNSLSRDKELFAPKEPGKVGIYVCGMTVYDFCHIGHARVLVVFDMVVRVLRAKGFDVKYIRNITDIDDKIIARATEIGEPFDVLTERFISAMHEDETALNVIPPDEEPRATGHITEIISMIETLQSRDLAYQGKNGDVFFRVRQFPGYGLLSGRSIDELLSGARVDKDVAKDDPLDFVLWKVAKAREPAWPSPWGDGRPGWHIECSAMSTACLGDSFDIHGGGMDLRFPHHENEIAQTEGATGKKFVNVWMHNGFVQIDHEKMSKSLGNFFTIREILKNDQNPERAGEVVRFLMLLSHYRSPLNFSDGGLDQARAGLERLYSALQKSTTGDLSTTPPVNDQFALTFDRALDDDFNTPSAIAVLFDIAKEINRAIDQGKRSLAAAYGVELKRLADILGLLYLNPTVFLGISGSNHSSGAEGDSSLIESLVQQRQAARLSRDFDRADAIRGELEALNVLIEDRPDGTCEWRRR